MLASRFRRSDARDLSLARELLLGIQAAGVPTYRQTIPAIAAELRRCRRYERPLAVVTVALEGPDNAAPAAAETLRALPAVSDSRLAGPQPAPPLQTGLDCMLFLLLGTLLRDVTRESDLVTYAAEEHVYALFLAEIGADEAALAAQRLARALHERAGVRIRAGIAEFPAHGLTVEALFDRAVAEMAGASPVPFEAAHRPEEAEWQNLRSAR